MSVPTEVYDEFNARLDEYIDNLSTAAHKFFREKYDREKREDEAKKAEKAETEEDSVSKLEHDA